MSAANPIPFGRYELLERVAMGGMAEVFRARSVGRDGFSKEVCIKRILPQFCGEEEFVKMFIDEAMLASRLQHANIVQIFDFDQVDGSYYIAMEYVLGKDLRTVNKQGHQGGNPPGVYRSALIVAEMCKGLHYAHQKDGMGLVHRDISPHNVLVSMAGEVKVMDFGIAKAADRITRTSTGIIKGKIPYMAPEQAAGADLDHRVDQFATGLVLYELLTGKRAYEGAEPTALRKALNGEVEPPSLACPDIPPELDEVFLRMTAREPTARYPDMRACERALTQFIYSRAPDDSELDLSVYMQQLFGSLEKVRTQVLPGRGTPSSSSNPVMTGQVDVAAPTSRSAPDAILASGGVAARNDATQTHMANTPTPLAPAARNDVAEAPRGTRLLPLVAGLGVLTVASAGVTWMVVGKKAEPPPVVSAAAPAPVEAPPAVTSPPVEEKAPPQEEPAPEDPAAAARAEKAPAQPPEEKAPVKVAREPAGRERPTRTAAPRGRGKVEVRTTGTWAQVYYRGEMVLAETPGVVELAAGKQTITLRNPETGKTIKRVVTIKPDETVKISVPIR